MQDVSKIGFGGRLVRESDKRADKGLTADERSGQKGKGIEGGFQGPLREERRQATQEYRDVRKDPS